MAIAMLQRQGAAAWWAPLLKCSFNIGYVVLATFVGPLAEAMVKAWLMVATNGLKALGVLVLLASGEPLLAFAIVGIGAAA